MKNFVIASILSLSLATLPAVAQDAPKVSANDIAVATKSSQGEAAVEWVLPLLLVAVALTALSSGGGGMSYYAVSDQRLKRDIVPVGTAENGLTIYQYRYVGLSTTYQGVMAQEVLAHSPEAVITLPFGYLGVDYAKLGIDLVKVD